MKEYYFCFILSEILDYVTQTNIFNLQNIVQHNYSLVLILVRCFVFCMAFLVISCNRLADF